MPYQASESVVAEAVYLSLQRHHAEDMRLHITGRRPIWHIYSSTRRLVSCSLAPSWSDCRWGRSREILWAHCCSACLCNRFLCSMRSGCLGYLDDLLLGGKKDMMFSRVILP